MVYLDSQQLKALKARARAEGVSLAELIRRLVRAHLEEHQALPKGFGGLVDSVATPVHATGVGLVQYGVMRSSQNRDDQAFVQNGDRFREILRKMTDWVKQYV